MESDKLTYDGYCVRGVPIAWDDGSGTGDWVVFMAARMGYSGIYIKPREANDNGLRTLVKGERSSRFESLHMLRSGIDATNSGLVAFSSKSKDKDVIYIYDLNEGKVVADYRMSDLVAVRSPRFSPDEARLVFTGFKSSGYSDLFLLDLETGESRAITSDIFDDFDPAFTSDGKRIIFASDRCAQGATGATCIFEIGLTGGDVTQLTCGDQRDQSPEPTEHGIYFSSDREGTFNLHLLDNYGNIVRKSDFVTGVLDPRLSPDGTRLLFSGYQGMRFQVYQVDVETTSEPVECFTSSDSVSWFPNKIETRYSETSIKYDTDYSLDIAQSMIGYDPIYGSVGGIQVSVSDVLGDHSFYFLLANTASNKEDFLSSFNAGVTYINREKRLNWGVGAFHLYNEYYNDHDQYYDHRQAGLLSLVSYPISKFNRFDLSCFARYSHKDLRYGFEDSEGFLVSNYVSWVFDNSIWDISGPIEGRRYNLSAGVTFSVNEGRNWNRVAFADIRHYFRLGRYSAIANRLFAYSSGGFDPQRMYLGGSWSLRGYDTRAFYNRNILFASNELRFPLIDALLIGFPIGGFGFQAIRGALFFDVGSAWDDDFDQFLGSFGGGFRVGLGYVMLLRFDFARTTDFRTISPSTDFDFFFGWNF
ncbi:MAG: hypothetical protein DRP45_00540 [Candidatus Zixiibacteriota bacterium]|nr:MAG: hypothetical protein DRP45_00540 [candidate division Zixibacteria bacterium]